jgi:hypothetical protein
LVAQTYVLDGHQRLSTLFGALTEPASGRPEGSPYAIWYELGGADTPRFRFGRQLPTERPLPLRFLPLTALRDGRIFATLRDALYREGLDPLAEEARQLRNAFMDYVIPVVPLMSDDLGAVTDAFVRINSRGSTMTEAHMLRALSHRQPQDSDRALKDLTTQLPSRWRSIPEKDLITCLKVIYGMDPYRGEVSVLNERLCEDPTGYKRLLTALVEATSLLGWLGVRGLSILPYTFQLVALVGVAATAPGRLTEWRQPIRTWFLRTCYAESFTGATGASLMRAIDDILHYAPHGEIPARAGERRAERAASVRMGTVRAKTLALRLAQDPDSEALKNERLEGLLGDARLRRLFPSQEAVPGNLVVATQTELFALRRALRETGPSAEDVDRFALPRSWKSFPVSDEGAFVEARGDEIEEYDQEIMSSCGL